jgi:sugar phosphate isomerase/epimerase
LGVVKVAFGSKADVVVAAFEAASLGFQHIDAFVSDLAGVEPASLPIPVGDLLSGFDPVPGCTSRAPSKALGWDEAVAFLRTRPNLRVEPTPASILCSVDAVRSMCRAVPGLRITLDTGWVATWGEDPVDLVMLADHVQLRQARRGVPQVNPGEDGDVDFEAVIAALDRVGYPGGLSIEYFDLPDMGLPLAEPLEWCVGLAARIRSLLMA